MSEEVRLTGVALKKDGLVYTLYGKLASHDALIRHHKLEFDPRNDVKGFVVTGDRFVSRYEAADIGRASGQVKIECRELFSGDIDWDAVKKPEPRPKGSKRWPTKRKLF